MNALSPALVARPERDRKDRRLLVGEQRRLVAIMHQRLMWAMLIYGALIALVVLRLLWLGIAGPGQSGAARAIDSGPQRGDIVDRDGLPLAQTIDVWSVGLQPAKIIGNKDRLARELARLMPERDVAGWRQLIGSDKRFIYLRRRAAPQLVEAINRLGEPGLALDREPDRLYPQTVLAAPVIGWTDIDGKGAAGVERAFDARLTDPATRGQPLSLSISSRIQQALENELEGAMQRFSAIGAAGVVMDIHTGEVLAMTSLPSLNLNDAGNGSPEARFNRATLGVYELGSTFKPFTVAMAMDAGIVKSMGQMFACPREWNIYGQTVGDTHPFGRACSVAEIMQESSNIGTAQIADRLGKERMKDFLGRMGFLSPLEIELKERGRTLTPGARWGPFETVTMGYGHAIAVTPLHLASGYATLFNGGVYRPATIMKVGPEHKVPAGRRVYSEETSYKMRALLRLVVTHGTGRKADAPGYRVGGKTGTAEKLIGGRYSKNVVVTTFAGVFPMDEPRYVIVAMLDEPKGTAETFGFRTAGWNVAPVVSKTVGRIAPMLGVRPDRAREPDMKSVLPFIEVKKK